MYRLATNVFRYNTLYWIKRITLLSIAGYHMLHATSFLHHQVGFVPKSTGTPKWGYSITPSLWSLEFFIFLRTTPYGNGVFV